MALILGVEVGSVFYIQDTPVEVVSLQDYSLIKLKTGGVDYVITDKQAVEIYPRVFVSCGRPSQTQIERHRVLVEAANKSTIKRKELLDSGTITNEQFDKMSPIEYPYPLLFRLIIDAPRHLVILRSELYERQRK